MQIVHYRYLKHGDHSTSNAIAKVVLTSIHLHQTKIFFFSKRKPNNTIQSCHSDKVDNGGDKSESKFTNIRKSDQLVLLIPIVYILIWSVSFLGSLGPQQAATFWFLVDSRALSSLTQ